MATTTDLHALLHNKSLGKVRAFLSNARSTSSGSVGGPSSLLSRSPGSSHAGQLSGVAQVVAHEVNRRDHLGRTVLHLVVGETEDWALEWVEALLRVAGLAVNAQDSESGWSALHRALYAGNVSAARLLLAHPQIDASLKDHEGLTPFDLYNSTVDGTNPSLHATALPSTSTSSVPFKANPGRLELFTWGANRNFVLGFAGDSDRTYPERVQLNQHEGGEGLAAWEPLRVKDVAMARLHTAIVTDEARNNVRLCGYGTGGRLGPTTQTQFTFQPLQGFPHAVKSVVLSPDHTVVVTTTGDVWTFGLNRFAQLGYALDSPAPGEKTPVSATPTKQEAEPIQSVPRRVVGALKKEHVLGAACSRTHTAVFTEDSLFTWGTSRGQLGYATAEAQVLPRKVTILPAPVVQLTCTETATACLLESNEVVVLYKDAYHKLVFPLTPFPSRMQAYRPPNVSNKPIIKKITSCGNTFAALSSLGDVFTFAIEPNAAEGRVSIKPQRIWDLRRKFTAVTDVGVGLDGSIILCTVSGHVYVRTKKFEVVGAKNPLASSTGSSSGGGWKFARVPYLQRCIRVAANSTGAFAALRADVPLRFIEIEGPSLAENLLGILPHWRRVGPLGAKLGSQRRKQAGEGEGDEDDVDTGIERDVEVTLRLLQVLEEWSPAWEDHLKGSDAILVAEGKRIPIHAVLLAGRSPILAQKVQSGNELLELDCTALAALLLLHYLYSDDLPSLWDGRVIARLRELRQELDLDVQAIKTELIALAGELHLTQLDQSLSLHVKNAPVPSLAHDLGELLHPSSGTPSVEPDIVLVLADREVRCHSVVLRARCSFFETFYDDDEWTVRRLEAEGGLLRFDLSHFKWDVIRLVLDHVYLDKGMSLFQSVDLPSADEYIDFVTEVLSCANELLLDKLKLVCSAVLRSFVTLHNVGSILVDAAFYEANELGRACMYFIASSIETVLENRLLDDLPEELVEALGVFVRERQGAKSPVSRSGFLWEEMMAKHATWAAELDVARPTGGAKKFIPRAGIKSPRVSAINTPQLLSPNSSPLLTPSKLFTPNGSPAFRASAGDDVPFAMDEDNFDLDAPRPSAPTPNAAMGFGVSGRRKSTPGGTPLVGSPGAKSFLPLGSPPPPRLQPWGAQQASASAASTDNSLAAIMARESAAAAAMTKMRPAPGPIVGGSPSLGGSSATGSWRAASSKGRPSLLDIQSEQSTSRPRVEQTRSITRHPGPPAQAPPSSSPPVARSAAPGPIFTPSRLTDRSASGSGSRMQWSNYGPAAPSPPMISLSPPTTTAPPTLRPSASTFSPGLPFTPAPPSPVPNSPPAQSFAQIQAAQIAELNLVKEKKAPRSFAHVMAAEQAEAARKRDEELQRLQEEREAREFEKWFEEESRRVKKEEMRVRQMIAAEGSLGPGIIGGGGGGGGGGGRRKSGGGKGAKAPNGGGAGGSPVTGGSGGGRKKTPKEGGAAQQNGSGSPNPRARKGKGRASEPA